MPELVSPSFLSASEPFARPELGTETACPYCTRPGGEPIGSEGVVLCAACGFVYPLRAARQRLADRQALALASVIAPGTVLRERYRLLELLGQGAHGLTFLAQHEFLSSPCVVKVLPYTVVDAQDNAVRRLRNEAAAGFLVNNRHVVRVVDCDSIRGIWYLVMEYVEGADLGCIVRAGVRICWQQLVGLATDAAVGLEAIHRAGLVHRDVKPGNLILGIDGRVSVADLGVAAFIERHPGMSDATSHERVGTLAYAAPEALEDPAAVSPRTDLYSLGASLYELLVGEPPHGRSLYRSFLTRQSERVSWPAAVAAGAPAWLLELISRLLEPEPGRRFSSAAEVREALEARNEPAEHRSGVMQLDVWEPRGLVVLPFRNESGQAADDWLGHHLADCLMRTLSVVPGVYMVDQEQFHATLERVSQRGPAARREQLLDAGRLSGAASVIEGAFRRWGDKIELSLEVLERLPREEPVVAPVCGPLADLANLERKLGEALMRALRLSPASEGRPVSTLPVVTLAARERFVVAKRAFLRGDYEQALALTREAIEHSPDFCEAIGFLGVCCARMGRYEEAQAFNAQQRGLAERSSDLRQMVEAHANLGTMHYFRGEYAAANESLTRAVQIAESLGLTTDVALIRNNLGFILLQLGRVDEAEAMFRQAIETHRRYGAIVSLIGPYNGIGHVLREQKRYDEARRQFRRALTLAHEAEDFVNIGVAYMNLGHCAALQGRFSEAQRELTAALNILERTSFWNGLGRVYEYMADLNLELGHYTEAARCADLRIALARRHANLRMEAAAWRQKGSALERAGRLESAALCYERASEAEQGRLPDWPPGANVGGGRE